MVADDDGMLRAYDGASQALLFSDPPTWLTVHALRLGDVDGDSFNEILITETAGPGSGSSRLLVRRASDPLVVEWTSPPLAGQAGTGSTLLLTDADDDGRNEIVVGTEHGVRVFEYASGGPDVTLRHGCPSIVGPSCDPSYYPRTGGNPRIFRAFLLLWPAVSTR